MTIKEFKKELEKYDENVIIEGIADGPICDFSDVDFRFFHCWDENNREILIIWVTDIEDAKMMAEAAEDAEEN